eukprot:3183586-Lingulodinium_polyedra.AAC.1
MDAQRIGVGASTASGNAEAAAWVAERRRLLKLFQEAIDQSQNKEAQHATEVREMCSKHEHVILDLQCRLDAEEA